ncbi:MAG: DNA-directed DNA polymerase [Limnohabitans sp.]
MLRTLFIDFNSYFASVEQQLDPALRGRPVGVVPVMADSSCCIAASYEAKAFGVKTGTRVAEARRLCPDIALVLADHAKYVQVHQQAVAVVDRLAPVRQVVSIDEMECELTGRWRERERAVQLAQQIKAVLLTELGECMRTSVGIAPNTLLGKLASDMHKPDGLTVIELHELPGRLYPLPLSALNGIGPRMLRRLAACGITSMQQLYAAPRDLLHTAWGGVAGSEMYDKLRGQWYGPRATTARSLGHSHVLPPDMRQPESARQVLHRLTLKAAMRLRKQGFYASAMQVFVRCDAHWQREAGGERCARVGETQDSAFLLRTLDRLWFSGLHLLMRPVAVGVHLLGLVPASQHTPDLFDALDKTPAGAVPSLQRPAVRRDRTRLMAAMDALNRAHGKNAVYFASAHHALDAAPMRIAFNRIPDLETER